MPTFLKGFSALASYFFKGYSVVSLVAKVRNARQFFYKSLKKISQLALFSQIPFRLMIFRPKDIDFLTRHTMICC
jgi:hypothetical protein